jgi:hypothetical protein
MKRYQSHKIVEAEKVIRWTLGHGTATLEGADGALVIIPIARVQGITTDDLGYIVCYRDGYTSWSPSKAFEEGHTEIPA